MGLSSSLLIGRSALTASQLALQVTGNNIANVSTEGYSRQVVRTDPLGGGRETSRIFVGRGVSVSDVRRTLDPAVQTRLRNGISDEAAASVSRDVASQIESILNELTDSDLSSELSRFFKGFSEVANNPTSSVNRASAVEQGASIASFIRGLRADLSDARTQLDDQLASEVARADVLLEQIAGLNGAVVASELGGGIDSGLRDQRDQLVAELATLIDVNVIEQSSGAVDILVGSAPIVLGSEARGLKFERKTVDDALQVNVVIEATQETLAITGGSIGGRLAERGQSIDEVIDRLDDLASNLIFEVNKLHTSGRPTKRLTDVTGWLAVPAADRTRAFNDPANVTFAELPHRPKTGSFDVVVTDAAGNQTVRTINVDLDGITSTGAAGTADDTSLASLTTALGGVPNLTASITAAGELRITAGAGYDVSFKNDTSGVLAVLGVNTFFQGKDAVDIAVRADLRSDPLRLSVGTGVGTNETALAIAGLQTRGVASLDGDTLGERWLKTVERTAVGVASATTRYESAATVRQNLEAQKAAVSGVSLDEEGLNLIAHQQAYQGAARFVSVVQDMTQILLNLV